LGYHGPGLRGHVYGKEACPRMREAWHPSEKIFA
jgi:hypothetical protein